MESIKQNVTDLGQYARTRGRANGAGRPPLDDCREISVVRLVEALRHSLAESVQQMLPLAEKAAGLDTYHLYMDALELARDHADAIADAFRTEYLDRFNAACRTAGGRETVIKASDLALQDPDDLEESLAAGSLANAIFNACSEELFGLGKRIGLLINDPDLLHGDNPLGPEVIGASVMAALEAVQAAMKVRLLLMSMLGRHMPERVREIYREINRRLVERNVLPTIRVGMRRDGTAAVSASSSAAVSANQAGDATGAGGGDLLGVLHQLMSGAAPSMAGGLPAGWPGMAQAAGAIAPDLAQAMRRPGTFLHALNQLQHGRGEGVPLGGLDPAQFGAGQVNVLRGLRGGELAGTMNPLDGMTLDIVAMVFDYILDDDRIPDAIKALIGRLQLPVLKVAMLDKSFFSHKTHPVRRFLDGLADAALGWDDREGHEGGLYRKIEQLVEGVLQGFEDDLDTFDTALADLEAYLDDERKVAVANAARSARTLKTREQEDADRHAAHAEVESCLAGRRVPGAIRAFLFEYWENLLADMYRKAGVDSEPWRGAVDTMSDLVWSVLPKPDAGERRDLVAMLPGLLKRLDEGVRYLGLDQAARDAFFSSLVKCHALAVRAGLVDEGDSLPDEPDFSDVPVLDQAIDFQPVEPADGQAEPETVAEIEAGEALEEITIRALEWSEGDELASPEPPPGLVLGNLKRGSWIAYRQDNGDEVIAKLSWISPMQGLYLFTNRQGQRAMSINAAGLAAKLEAGEVRILDAVPLMDRVVTSLVEKLKLNAA